MTTLRETLEAALRDDNVQAFLRVIRAGETSQDDAAYQTLYGGGTFDDLSKHPNRVITAGKWTSTAAGAFQFLNRTWVAVAQAVPLSDFSPRSQDLGAVYLIRGRKALDDVIAGRFEQAVAKCAREWASLPGSPYGQPVKTMEQALATYVQWGGQFHPATESTPVTPAAPELEQPVVPLAPFIAAALPALIEAVPKLGALFSSGSETSQRNLKAAEVVVGIAKDAIGARNEQELVETLKADPGAALTVRQAVEAQWFQVTEAGGGGIDGARKADAAFVAGGRAVWSSPAFIISALLLAMPFMLLFDVFFVHPDSYDSALRTQIVTGVLSLAGVVGAFWLGSSYGSQKKDERLAP